MKTPKWLINWDNIHFSFNNIDSYNRPFNFVISGRGSGKTTTAAVRKLYAGWKAGTPWIVFRRLKVELNEEYITGIEGVINDFIKKKIIFTYKKGNLQSGMIDVFVEDKLFCRFVALSCSLAMLKSYYVRNCGGTMFDEFICSLKNGEKYLKNEFFKFKETYTTYNRYSKGILKCYLLGNPYSLYNPYFLNMGVEVEKLKVGEIYAPKGRNVVVDFFEITPELKKLILKKNPLFDFDEEYKSYALNGSVVDDKNIRLVKIHPNGFKLSQVYFIQDKNLAIYYNATDKGELNYWVSLVDTKEITRKVYCLDINDLSTNRVALSLNDLRQNRNLANAMRTNLIGFKDINCYYLFLEIYRLL